MGAQFLFQLLCAIAIAARPRLGAVFVPAIPARMGVLYTDQIEIFFPICPLFRQWRIAKAGLDPGGGAVPIHPRLVHIVNVLVAGDRIFSERAVID